MKDYTLAVIIPCWNCEPYIGQMLDCLLNQTFSDWKAFLVDDGCTDGTAAVIKGFSVEDARINYVLRDRGPKGAQTCRNIGFDLSKGARYVVFFDADDLIATYCFEQRVCFMDNHPNLDFGVFPAKAFVNDIWDNTNYVYGIRFLDDDLQALLNWNLPMVVWNNIYCRQSLVDYGLGWDENLLSLQDSDFNIHALVKGMHYEYANVFVDYFYRIIDDGVAKKIRSEQQYDSHVYLLNKTLELVSNHSKCYAFYLKNNVLLFVDLMQGNRSHLRQITKLPWIRKKVWFRFKLMLLLSLNFRGRKRLFPKEVLYSRQLSKCWMESMEKTAERFRLNANGMANNEIF